MLGKRKRSTSDSAGTNENENPIDKLNSKVENLQKSIDELRKEQKSDTENLKILISEKLEKSDKAEDSNGERKPSFNSIVSPGFLMKNVPNSGTSLQAVGRSFVMKSVFKDVSKIGELKPNFGNIEEHFGLPWVPVLIKKKEEVVLVLRINKQLSIEKWSIEADNELKIGEHRESKATVFGTDEDYENSKKMVAMDLLKRFEWEELKENYLADDNLSVEVLVKINKLIGVYKENLRSFDESMKELSDVVLVVGGQKFYVLKMYLATHSPYFKTLLLGQFQESTQSEIELSGIAPEDFQNFLEVLYGDPSIDEITVEGILLIADMYDTSIAIRKCEDFLLEKSKKSKKKKLQMAIRYNLDKLKEKCMSEIKTVEDIKSMIPRNVKDLDSSILAELLEKSISLQ